MNRGQIKIQEMAFVLVAFMIFFALVGLLYLSVRTSQMRGNVENLHDDEARQIVRKLAATPEFSWSDCSGCIDMDKVIALREQVKNKTYQNLWDLDYLAIELVYPARAGGECSLGNYPLCNKTIIIKTQENYGVAYSAFVSLCHWEADTNYEKCELGRIYAAGKGVSRV